MGINVSRSCQLSDDVSLRYKVSNTALWSYTPYTYSGDSLPTAVGFGQTSEYYSA